MAVNRTNMMEQLRQSATTNAFPIGRVSHTPRTGLMALMAGVAATGGPGAAFNPGLEGAN